MRRKIHVGHPDNQHPDLANPAVDATAPGAEATGTNADPPDDRGDRIGDGTDPQAERLSVELESAREEIERLRAELERAEAARDDAHNQYLRTLADSQNFRRRKEEEARTDRQFANRELIIALLPVIDNFERAMAAAQSTQSYDALIEGVKLTQRQLQAFLQKAGVEAIEAQDQPFDPNYHEAVMRVEDSGAPDNTIVEELQRGYKMHDRVLRPSMVKVAHDG